jgi:UDP-GlcNAc3NAcA epimerase
MKILSIVGARPEFIQSSPVSQELRQKHLEILVHTGQHYDYLMSQTFFNELGIPQPDYNLEVGSGMHGHQTGEILMRLEEVLLKEKPDWVIVRGDTNSTIAGAIASSKLHILTAHIEAGERSYNREMPEEINRLVTDAVADLHFCASHTAVDNLSKEGVFSTVHWVGDVMYDAMLKNRPIAREKSMVLQTLNLLPKQYSLVTIHRSANTDDPIRLAQIISILNHSGETVIFPVHPRTRNALGRLDGHFSERVHLIEPVGYYDMMMLEENARIIATDSGGVQREAYFHAIPCLTLREETEWVETVKVGWNRLVGTQPENVLENWYSFTPLAEHPPIFGDGHAAQKIQEIISA